MITKILPLENLELYSLHQRRCGLLIKGSVVCSSKEVWSAHQRRCGGDVVCNVVVGCSKVGESDGCGLTDFDVAMWLWYFA